MNIRGSVLAHLEASTGHRWDLDLLAEAVKEAAVREGASAAGVAKKIRDARNGGTLDRIEVGATSTSIRRR